MKNKTAKIFSAGFIAYLLLQVANGLANTYYAVFGCIQLAQSMPSAPDVSAIQGDLLTMVFSGVTVLLSALTYALLAVIAGSALIEKCGTLKGKLHKAWFIPGALYVLQTVLYVSAEFASVFAQPTEYLMTYLANAASNVGQNLVFRIVIAVLYFTLPRVLLENDLFVFKKETTQTQVATTDAE